MERKLKGGLRKNVLFTGMHAIDFERVVLQLSKLDVPILVCHSREEVERHVAQTAARASAIIMNPADDPSIAHIAAPEKESFYIVFLDVHDTVASRAEGPAWGSTTGTPIDAERSALQRLRKYAMAVIDVGRLSDVQLRHRLRESIELTHVTPEERPRIEIVTFGFKYGPPQDLNLLFDARVLPNPFWVEELRSGTGLDAAVYDYVMSAEASLRFVDTIADWIEWSTPLYSERKQHQLQVGIGCTGGQHRSVAVGIAVEERVRALNFPTLLRHRDLERRSIEDAIPIHPIANM